MFNQLFDKEYYAELVTFPNIIYSLLATSTILSISGIITNNKIIASTGIGSFTSMAIVLTNKDKKQSEKLDNSNSVLIKNQEYINEKFNQLQEDIHNQYSQLQQQVKVHTSQIVNLETHFEDANNNIRQQQQNLQAISSEHQQFIQKQNQLSFKIGNTERQLNNHNKKLKSHQHDLQTQKANQNKILSNVQKLHNKQQEISKIYTQELSKIQGQVDKKLIEIAQNNSSQFTPQSTTTSTKKVIASIVPRQPQTFCYIDNNNLYNCLKAMGSKPDYRALFVQLMELTPKTDQIQVKLYDGSFPNQKSKYLELERIGYQIHTFPIIKREQGNFKTVGDDVQLAIDMVKDVKPRDRVILITGDGDLYPAIQEIKQRNVNITVIARNKSVNRDLRDLADEFISLDSIQYNISQHTKIFA